MEWGEGAGGGAWGGEGASGVGRGSWWSGGEEGREILPNRG